MLFVILVGLLILLYYSPPVEGFLSRAGLQEGGEQNYNDFGRIQNPASSFTTADVQPSVSQATPRPTSTTSNLMTLDQNTMNVKAQHQNSILRDISVCEALDVNCGNISANCGMCIKDGVSSKGLKHKGGMYITTADKQRAVDLANGGPVSYRPSIGTCDPENFVIDSSSCSAAINRLQCSSMTTLDETKLCGKCGTSPTFVYMGEVRPAFNAILKVSNPGTNGPMTIIYKKRTIKLEASTQSGIDIQSVFLQGIRENDSIEISINGMPLYWCAWLEWLGRVVVANIKGSVSLDPNVYEVGTKTSPFITALYTSTSMAQIPSNVIWYTHNNNIPGIPISATYGDKDVLSIIRSKANDTNLIQVPEDFGTKSGSGISILEATYGKNCGVPVGNRTDLFKQKADGLQTLNFSYDYGSTGGDPAWGCAKNLDIKYTCNKETTVRSFGVPPEAGVGGKVELSCPASDSPTSYLSLRLDDGSDYTIADGSTVPNSLRNSVTFSIQCPATLKDPYYSIDGPNCANTPIYTTTDALSRSGLNVCADVSGTNCLRSLLLQAGGSTNGRLFKTALSTIYGSGRTDISGITTWLNSRYSAAIAGNDAASMDMFGISTADPCANKPYSEACLQATWIHAGCNAGGSLYPNTSKNVMLARSKGAISDISGFYRGIKSATLDRTDSSKWTTAMEQCTGTKYDTDAAASKTCKTDYEKCVTAVENTGFIPRVTWGSTPADTRALGDKCDRLLCPYFENVRTGKFTGYEAEKNYCDSIDINKSNYNKCVTAVETTGFVPRITWGSTPDDTRALGAECDRLLCPYFKNVKLTKFTGYEAEKNYCDSIGQG